MMRLISISISDVRLKLIFSFPLLRCQTGTDLQPRNTSFLLQKRELQSRWMTCESLTNCDPCKFFDKSHLDQFNFAGAMTRGQSLAEEQEEESRVVWRVRWSPMTAETVQAKHL